MKHLRGIVLGLLRGLVTAAATIVTVAITAYLYMPVFQRLWTMPGNSVLGAAMCGFIFGATLAVLSDVPAMWHSILWNRSDA